MNEIEQFHVPDRSNIFVIRNLITIDSTRKILHDDFTCDQYSAGKFTTISPNKSIKIMDEKEAVIGQYLNTINSSFEAKKNILFTWDHGSVFGINKVVGRGEAFAGKKDKPEPTYYVNPMLYSNDPPRFDKLNFFKSLVDGAKHPPLWLEKYLDKGGRKMDSGTPVIDLLSNEMLARAIEIGFAKKKLDILCMMNCCMQNLHAQYALKGNVKYLVAPQTWIYFPGYDYPALFNRLNELPNMSSRSLAVLIVELCRLDSLKKNKRVEKADYEAIFAIDLSCIAETYTLIKSSLDWEIAQLKHIPGLRKNLVWLFCNQYCEYEQMDAPNYRLLDLLEVYQNRTVAGASPFPDWRKKIADKLFWLIRGSIVNSFIGNYVYEIGYQPSGLAMSLPDYNTFSNTNQVFISLFYSEQSPYRSALVADLALDTFFLDLYQLKSS